MQVNQILQRAAATLLSLIVAAQVALVPAYASDESVADVEEPSLCAHESDGGTLTKEPTCSQSGEIIFKCMLCGETLNVAVIPKKEHTPSETGVVVRQPSIYDVGQENYYCTVCGELVFCRSIPQLEWPHTDKPVPPPPTEKPEPTVVPDVTPAPDETLPPTPSNEPIDPVVPADPQHCQHEWVNDGDSRYCKKCNTIEHYHQFSTNWKYNEAGHWKECLVMNCGQRKLWSEHDWVTDANGTTCRVCGYVKGSATQPTPAPSHGVVPDSNPAPTPDSNKQNHNAVYYHPANDIIAPSPSSTQPPRKKVNGSTTVGAKDVLQKNAAAASSAEPAVDQSIEALTEEPPKAARIAVTVPIFFHNAEFDESGNFFAGKLAFQTSSLSFPVEIDDFALKAGKGWKLSKYEGEDVVRKRSISAVINRCPSEKNEFPFNPKYFTTPIPSNGLLELPYKVCVAGPEWTSSKTTPLSIVVTMRPVH